MKLCYPRGPSNGRKVAFLREAFSREVPRGLKVRVKSNDKLSPAHAQKTKRGKWREVLIPQIVDIASFAYAVHELLHVKMGHLDATDTVTTEYECERETIRVMKRYGIPMEARTLALMKKNVRDELDLWYKHDVIAPYEVRRWCGWVKPPLVEHRV